MAGITKAFVNGRYRLLRTFSYRDANNKPQNVKKIIGTFDPDTDKIIFNRYFITLMEQQNITFDMINSIEWRKIPELINFGTLNPDHKTISEPEINKIDPEEKISSIEQISNSQNTLTNSIETIKISLNDDHDYIYSINDYNCKKFGPFLLLNQCLLETGLLKILQNVFPSTWEEISTLSYYLVCSNKALMYCDNWTEDYTTFLSKQNLQSQRISELLSSIRHIDIMNFYEEWAKLRTESEYLALDITSISSYSNLIGSVEPGYNRDKENLPQVNYCLLFGEKSGLPVFSSLYTGSINDVSSLGSFIDQISFISNKDYNLVMDKGFYSKSNIEYILNKFPSYKFLIALPFTTDLTRKIVANGLENFDKSLYFQIGKDNLLGYSFYKSLDLSHNLKYHVFYNNKLYNDRYNNLISDAILLRKNAEKDPQHYKNIKEYTKYLNFKSNKSNNNVDISINHDRIEFELKNTGWLIIVGNDLDISYENVCHIYRSKDCVEKAFDRLKNNLDLSRLRVHDDLKANNKLFISFVSLIILSYIHNVMDKFNLYSSFTLVELIESLGKIKLLKTNENQTITPISKTNRMILKYFNIKIT